eukprot:snap_masked-scaffold_16-processed-gene-2.9-mRNA-1 protein AED:0.93 eAED:1.00 QI:0/-1/0/1/-1/1/1/0/134
MRSLIQKLVLTALMNLSLVLGQNEELPPELEKVMDPNFLVNMERENQNLLLLQAEEKAREFDEFSTGLINQAEIESGKIAKELVENREHNAKIKEIRQEEYLKEQERVLEMLDEGRERAERQVLKSRKVNEKYL